MKNIMITTALLFVCTCLTQAQNLKESEMPAVVKDSFTKHFPKSKEVKWFKESDIGFEAEFENMGKEQSANFDNTGKWLETETEIKKSELPQRILATIGKEFVGYKIEEAEKVETPDRGKFFEVALEKGNVNYEVQFSEDGKILKKEAKKENDKD